MDVYEEGEGRTTCVDEESTVLMRIYDVEGGSTVSEMCFFIVAGKTNLGTGWG